MPEISRFYGIVIKMYFADHNPPHFHAEYAEYVAEYDIFSLRVLAGKLPLRADALVKEWAARHKKELLKNWYRASVSKPLKSIEPLD